MYNSRYDVINKNKQVETERNVLKNIILSKKTFFWDNFKHFIMIVNVLEKNATYLNSL